MNTSKEYNDKIVDLIILLEKNNSDKTKKENEVYHTNIRNYLKEYCGSNIIVNQYKKGADTIYNYNLFNKTQEHNGICILLTNADDALYNENNDIATHEIKNNISQELKNILTNSNISQRSSINFYLILDQKIIIISKILEHLYNNKDINIYYKDRYSEEVKAFKIEGILTELLNKIATELSYSSSHDVIEKIKEFNRNSGYHIKSKRTLFEFNFTELVYGIFFRQDLMILIKYLIHLYNESTSEMQNIIMEYLIKLDNEVMEIIFKYVFTTI